MDDDQGIRNQRYPFMEIIDDIASIRSIDPFYPGSQGKLEHPDGKTAITERNGEIPPGLPPGWRVTQEQNEDWRKDQEYIEYDPKNGWKSVFCFHATIINNDL